MKRLNAEQVSALLKPIKPSRVMQANGQSHVPAYDVAAHLTRILGFGGWDKEILSLILVNETEGTTSGGKAAWEVTYACTLRLVIKDENGDPIATWDDGACGTSKQPQRGEAHDMALKSSISYALKRCAAFGLGDQFGLSLYNKGNTSALIAKTLVGSEVAVNGSIDLESHIPVPLTLGNDETQEDNGQEIDYKADLAMALKITGMTKTEQKEFIEGAIEHPLGAFSDLTQEEAKVAHAKLRLAILEADKDA